MDADLSWTFEPGSVLLLLGLLGAYLARWARVRRESRARSRPAGTGRLVLFLAGWLVLVAALVSPVDALGEQLFAMHMVQHVLMLDVAPVLLMLALTKVLLRPATRRLQAVERSAGVLAHPVTAVVVYVAVMWLWHVPVLYEAAVRHPAVHVLEHVSFLSAGLLYWWHLLSPIRSRISIGPFGPVVYMLATKLFVGLLGIAITFAPDALYDVYVERQGLWGLSATDDQALAGAIMAVEQSVVMGVVLAWLFVKALADSERDEERAERYADAV